MFSNFFNMFKNTPEIHDNTFLIWEPCSQSHSEVVPGYTKYLLDLGYHVSVIVNPKRYKEGLFSRFNDKNVTLNKISPGYIKKYFKTNSINQAKGLLITTMGKLCDNSNIEQAYQHFPNETDKSKLFFVEHDAKIAIDENHWNENIITLRKLNYKNAKSVIVNPHYFGNVKLTSKNPDITNFITIGAINPKRKSSTMIIDAVEKLYKKGITNFKVTVVGKGHLKDLPKSIRSFFNIKGRLPFDKMYEEIEKADFMLTAYNDKDEKHQRYNTVGTSGNFQLVYGFLKPCIIIKSFAEINGFDNNNSILYDSIEDYSNAFIKGIESTQEEYQNMQNNLKIYVDKLYQESKNNLEGLINGK